MEKKSAMINVYGVVLIVCFVTLAMLQFYPEQFKVDKSTIGILKIALGSLGFVVVGFWERERKKKKGDLK